MSGSHPYERLAIIYRRRKEFGHEVRVILRAIESHKANPSGWSAEGCAKRLAKARTLMQEAGQSVPAAPPVPSHPDLTDGEVQRTLPWNQPDAEVFAAPVPTGNTSASKGLIAKLFGR